MKKILSILILSIFFSASKVNAETILVKSLEAFSTEKPSITYKVKTIRAEQISDDLVLMPGTVISGYVLRVHEPQFGKRDSYFEFVPTMLIYGGKSKDISNTKIVGRILGYKPIDPQDLMFNVARKTANFVFKGAISAAEFVQGAVEAQDGQRIKSGAQKVYKDSFVSYIETGKELNVKSGDLLVLKLKTRR